MTAQLIKTFKTISLFGSLLLLLSSETAFSATAKSFKLPTDARIKFERVGVDGDGPDGQVCADFRVNEAELRKMFATYTEVPPKVLHDYYDWLPCFVEGTVTVQDRTFTFKARAGNILRTDFPDKVSREIAGQRTTSPSGR